jgi:hypothetical protein
MFAVSRCALTSLADRANKLAEPDYGAVRLGTYSRRVAIRLPRWTRIGARGRSRRMRLSSIHLGVLLVLVGGCASSESLDVPDDAGNSFPFPPAMLGTGGVRPIASGGSGATFAAGGFPVTPPPPPSAGGFGGEFPQATGGGGGSFPLGAGGTTSTPPETGGTTSDPSSGGAKNTGGAPVQSAGGTTATPTCTTAQKLCGGACVTPAPKMGCTLTGCDPCPGAAPENGFQKCTNGTCDFDCFSGYTRGDAGACIGPPPGSNTGSCPSSPLACPSCGAVFGPGCCNGSKCGCSPIPWTIGVLGCI